MKVIIIGAGLGGLSAATSFANSGHDVELLERSRELNSTGGGISIRPSAGKIIQAWGLQHALESICDRSSSVTYRDWSTGNVGNRIFDAPQHADWGTTRRAMVKLLYVAACRAGARIRFNAPVKNVFDDDSHATVTLENGECISGDIVLAADGIKSHTRRNILADLGPYQKWEPVVHNTTFYSFDMGVSKITTDPASMGLTENSDINIWMGDGGFVVTRFSSRFQRIGLLFAIQAETDQKSLWDDQGDIEHVRKFFAASCPDLRKALQAAEACDRWRIAEVPDLPRWSSKSGRIILLGDSAHAMHPNAAQGFSTIIEDIGVLEFLLSSQSALTVPEIVNIWESIRKPRAERVKQFSTWNTTHYSEHDSTQSKLAINGGKEAQYENIKQNKDADFDTLEFWKWNAEYDAIDEANRYLARQAMSKL